MIPGGTFRLCAWLLCTAALLLFSGWAYDVELILPTMMFFVAASAGVLFAPGNLGLLSWSAGIPAYYALVFLALPIVSRLTGGEHGSDADTAQALYVASAGIIAFTVGTNAMRITRGPGTRYDMLGLLRIDAERVVYPLIAIGAAAMLWSYAFGYFGLMESDLEANAAAGPASALGYLLVIAHVLAWNAYFTQGRLLRAAVLTTLILTSAGMVASSKGQMLTPFALIALCQWGGTGKFPLKLTVTAALLYVFVAFPFVTASRFVLAAGGTREGFAGLAIDYLLSGRWVEDAENYSAVNSLGRGLMSYFADIVNQSGSIVPFMDGRTLAEGVEMQIPRFFYPDKPDITISNWTAREFGAIDSKDMLTNIAPSFMGEFYMNFGLLGVCVGMFLVGMLAVLVDRYVIVHRQTWTMPIAVAYVGWQESVIGQTILPFMKNGLVVLPLLLLLAHRPRLRW